MAYIMPLLITIQWLPLEIYGAAPPYLSCIGSLQSVLLLIVHLIDLSLFWKKC